MILENSCTIKDRMEFIEILFLYSKWEISYCKRLFNSSRVRKHGLKNQKLVLNKSTIELIIAKYTREAGLEI